jgi:DNA polymerase-4
MSGPASALAALYLDFDSFFASAEQHLRPELRGRPVGIIPLDTPGTSLIAASREAKRFGFKVGTPLREARLACPGLAVVVARPDAYVKLHHRIIAVVDEVLPVHAVRSIDEMVCRLLDKEQARAVELARAVKAALARVIGPTLTCSIGLAPNELLAKIGAEMEKPDGLVVLSPDALPDRLLSLSLTDIPGVARGNAARLEAAGVTDVAGLLALAPRQMRAIWGGVEGERMHVALHGGAVERPATRRAMFGHSRVLPRDWRTPLRIRDCARLLLAKAARRLRREGFAARSLSFSARDRDRGRWSAEARFLPARDDHGLLCALDGLLRDARAAGALAGARTIYVALHDIVAWEDRPRDLFESADAVRARRRWELLAEIGDRLSERYGHAALTLGLQPQPPGGYAGAKIAFGRVPDLRDFA